MFSLRAELVTDVVELERLAESWRELAHTCARPVALPGWQLAWWRHVAPPDAALRAVIVRDDAERLVGVAPFFTEPTGRIDYRLLQAGTAHRLAPLAAPVREAEVTRLVAETLAAARPHPDLVAFEGIDVSSSWPAAVAAAWPGLRPWRYTASTLGAPVISLAGTIDRWLAGRSSKFRHELRHDKRVVEHSGGRIFRAMTPAELERGCESFAELHSRRMRDKGGRSGLPPAWFEALKEAAPSLSSRDELRLWLLELEGRIIAAQLFLAAGGEVQLVNGGWDASAAQYSPALVTIQAAIEDAFARGERRVDLGGGLEPFKLRFATGDAPITWTGVVPRTRRYPLTRARLAPHQLRGQAARIARRLPPGRRRQLKRLLGRA